MSKKSDQFEIDMVSLIEKYTTIPAVLPPWMRQEGILPGSRIIGVERVGNSGSKTDVIVRLDNPSEPIKISMKLNSAHHFGNWYGHDRIINEFGKDNFNSLVEDFTDWANYWKHESRANVFVGVSICFGKRSGKTAKEFTEIFDYRDIVKIVAGHGTGEKIANCLFVGKAVPPTMDKLISLIEPLSEDVILSLSKNFKVSYRPINPITNDTNRRKVVYTRFQPYKKMSKRVTVTTLEELNKLGEYVKVKESNLNHNHILDELDKDFNIYIPRKPAKPGKRRKEV